MFNSMNAYNSNFLHYSTSIFYSRVTFFCFLFFSFLLFSGPVDSLPNYLTSKKRTSIQSLVLPSIYNQIELKKSLDFESKSREKIYKYGTPIEVNRSVFDEVIPYQNNKSEWVYQVCIESKNALSLNLIFSSIHLEKGSYFYIICKNSTNFIGPINSSFFSSLSSYSSDLLFDDNVVIELVEPDKIKGTSKVFLDQVIHGFRTLNSSSISSFSSCNFDINSELANGFELQKNL